MGRKEVRVVHKTADFGPQFLKARLSFYVLPGDAVVVCEDDCPPGRSDEVVGAFCDGVSLDLHHSEGAGAVRFVIRGLEVQRDEGEP